MFRPQPIKTRKVRAAIAIALLLLSFTSTPDRVTIAREDRCAPAPRGLIALLPGTRDAGVAGVLIVDAGSGDVVTTVETPNLERIQALRIPGYALAQTVDGRTLLIDGGAGTATELVIPTGLGALLELRSALPTGPGERYTLIGDGREALLFDAIEGVVSDLRPLLGVDAPPLPLFNPALSSDERHVLVWDGVHTWLIPTVDPSNARALGTISSQSGTFSPDGSLVVYTRTAADETMRELVIEPADGSAPPEVVASGRYVHGVFAGGNDLIAFHGDAGKDSGDGGTPQARYVLFDRASGEARTLLEYDVNPANLFPAPDGSHVLFALQGSDGWRYAITDTATGELREIALAAGLSAAGPVDGRYRLLYPTTGLTDEVLAPGFLAVDLVAGTWTVLTPTETGDGIVNASPTFARDGSAATGTLMGRDVARTWHFDLATGTATILSDAPLAGVALSPDGCWVAIPGESGTRIQSPGGPAFSETDPGWQAAWLS